VDHFIPWSRHADDGLDNLVAADARCNGQKRDFLAAAADLAGIAAGACGDTGASSSASPSSARDRPPRWGTDHEIPAASLPFDCRF
jgi:hypothetical protein